MAAVDYGGVLEALQLIFQSDSRTSDARVYVEEDPAFGLGESDKGIVLVLDRRVPTSGQAMAAGKRTRHLLTIGVWVVGFNMESFREAGKVRDALLAQVELVLMDNRTISGLVTSGQLGGGEFLSAFVQGATPVHMAMAETKFEVEVSAINT